MPPDSDKSERFQDLVNVIFETPNPLEELANVAGVSLIFALFLSAFNTYICLVISVVPFCFVSDAMRFFYLCVCNVNCVLIFYVCGYVIGLCS